jgi:hypothetical protein
VIIGQVNVKSVTILEAKDDPPVAGYGHAPVAFQVSLERVKPVSRQIKVSRRFRPVEMRQNVPDTGRLIGPDSAWVVLLEQAPQTLMPKRPYHPLLYRVAVHVARRSNSLRSALSVTAIK